MIDLHSHVLPGIDDGAVDIKESIRICWAAAEDGVEVIAATPHVRDDFPTAPAQMEATLADVRAAVGDMIHVVAGGEIAIAELARPASELRRFGLAGNPAYLLVETPYFSWPTDFPERIERLRADGFTMVLAHPERNPVVQDKPEIVADVVDAGGLIQLTAASVDGRLGDEARATSFRLLDLRLAHSIARDAHSPRVRAVGFSAAVRAIENDALARWLTDEVPRAILEGTDVPERPGRTRRRR